MRTWTRRTLEVGKLHALLEMLSKGGIDVSPGHVANQLVADASGASGVPWLEAPGLAFTRCSTRDRCTLQGSWEQCCIGNQEQQVKSSAAWE
jgi:hypothetical protein